MTVSSTSPKVFKVIPTTQQYDWGKRGHLAKVAQFAEASRIPDFVVDENTPYAELWMGTHSSSPSRVSNDDGSGDVLPLLLSDHLRRNQDLIGSSVCDKFEDAKNGNLPFLFKVLSIAKALSIQSHPDKQTAKQLHAHSPKIYKDLNHKPEMALALTEFEALCGFRPLADIARHLRETPELESIIPPTILEKFYDVVGKPDNDERELTKEKKAALKNLFAAIMTAPHDIVHSAIHTLVHRHEQETTDDHPLRSLILRLHSQFPYDIGILCPHLLNILHLQPGDAIFLGAGEPHAYISGEAIECMANSDNVIRAGLTPKLRDVPNLVLGLTYECGEGTRHQVYPTLFSHEEGVGGSSGRSVIYDPPIEEFSVVKLDIPGRNGASVAQRAVAGPSLAIVTEGKGVMSWSQGEVGLRELHVGIGDVVFIGADVAMSFSTRAVAGSDGFVIYRAFVEA